MSVRLLFPTLLFEYNLLEEGIVTETYLQELKADMDGMRRKDPVGRQISNAYTGWQSNDGVEKRPAWTKMMRVLKDKFNNDVLGFHAIDRSKIQIDIGNVWANINDKGAWNKPHLHNGCWWSGALYIKADGDEGNLVAINTNHNVMTDFPPTPRHVESHAVAPITGTLLLFPSGMMHMVEPNQTNKDRYSVAFNTEIKYLGGDRDAFDIDRNWNQFDIENNELTR
tara:strand:+ start:33770 stop:34444 length:675 start_codon:yes stop_codon:yes gene_type:complete